MPISCLHDFLDALPQAERAEIDAVSTYRTVPIQYASDKR